MNKSDLPALKGSLIALGAAIAFGAGLPYYSQLRLAEAARDLARQQTQLSEARTRLQRSGDEKQIIVQYLGAYQYLQRLGFVGDEQRINWLDGLRLANQQTQLFGVDYQISTQHPYAHASELNPGQLSMYESSMRVTLRLLHEEDLMRFLGALAKQGAGVFSVNQCDIERIDTGGSIRFQPNLRAECELAWITLRPTTPPAEKKS
jgi:hypothetical protein